MSLVGLISIHQGPSLTAVGHATWDPGGKSLGIIAVEDHPGQAQDKVHMTFRWPQAELVMFLVVATSRTQDFSCGSRVLETAEFGLSLEANVSHLVKDSSGLGSGALNT